MTQEDFLSLVEIVGWARAIAIAQQEEPEDDA